MSPDAGTVGFGSGLHGWAFTLKQFARIYHQNFKIDLDKLMKRMWGDNFHNGKKWTTNPSTAMASTNSDAPYKRGFIAYVLDPIYKVRH